MGYTEDVAAAKAAVAAAELKVKQAEADVVTAQARVDTAKEVLETAQNAYLDAGHAVENAQDVVNSTQAALDYLLAHPPAPPVVVKTTKYGSAAGGPGATNAEKVANANKTFGGIDCLRAFQSNPMPNAWSSTGTAKEAPKGCMVMISDKENVKAYATGSAAVKAAVAARNISMLRSVPGDQDLIRIPFHEAEDNIESGQFTIDQYQIWCKAVAGWVKGVSAERVAAGKKPMYSASINMSWTLDPRSKRNIESYFVPELDLIGYDCYSVPNAQKLVEYVNKHPEKDWIVGEFGPTKSDVLKPINDSQFAATLKQIVDIFLTAKKPPLYVAYFQASQEANYVLDPSTHPISTAYIRSLCMQN